MVADVVNLSGTGALVRAEQRQAPGSQWPLILDVDGTPLQLTARVVRCELAPGPLSSSIGKFLLALTFLNLSPETMARLEQVCGTGRRVEGDVRRLHVSMVRRCPQCNSRDVAKEGRRSYSCCQCGRVFTGFRVGFLRVSR